MGMSDGDVGYMSSYDTSYTSGDDTFADVHNLDHCITYLNQSLVTLGFPSGLNLYSSEPGSIVRTCNCIYAMIQQRQRDIEYRETANETRQRLMSDKSRMEAKVERLTDQLASKERELQAITSKGNPVANVGFPSSSSGSASRPLEMDRTPTTFDVGITKPIGVDIPLPFEEAWARDIIVVKQKNDTLKSTQPVVNFPGKTFRRRGEKVRVMDTNDKEVFRMSYDRLKPNSDRHVSGRVAPGLTPKQLAALNLKDGKRNVIKFKVDYERRGTRVESSVECNIFLWNWDTKVVVTDVDGTITTSNCGNKLRKGVVRGFSVIKDNGYKIIYLSARPYSRLSSTRELLLTKQDGEFLPEGPVIHASEGYIPAFYRYFFGWHGTHFKQPYLEKVKRLFEGEQPFFAGFGDTITDAESYEEVGIEDIKVFHLVEEGIQVKLDGEVEVTYHNGYKSLVKFVNEKFPRLGTQNSAATSQEDSHNPGDDQQIPLRSKPGKQSQILPL